MPVSNIMLQFLKHLRGGVGLVGGGGIFVSGGVMRGGGKPTWGTKCIRANSLSRTIKALGIIKEHANAKASSH